MTPAGPISSVGPVRSREQPAGGAQDQSTQETPLGDPRISAGDPAERSRQPQTGL